MPVEKNACYGYILKWMTSCLKFSLGKQKFYTIFILQCLTQIQNNFS